MAFTYSTVSALFTAICDAIRAKTGGSAAIDHQDIPAAITNLPSGGGCEGILDNTVIDLVDHTAIKVTAFKMQNASALMSVDLPEVADLEESAFTSAFSSSVVAPATFPKVMSIAKNAFAYGAPVGLRFPVLTTCSGTLQFRCYQLASIDLGNLSTIGKIFDYAPALKVLALRRSATTTLSTQLPTCPVLSGTGYVLVPRARISGYESATNWSAIKAAGSSFLALEDYTVDGTTTGLLDETKINALLAA